MADIQISTGTGSTYIGHSAGRKRSREEQFGNYQQEALTTNTFYATSYNAADILSQ